MLRNIVSSCWCIVAVAGIISIFLHLPLVAGEVSSSEVHAAQNNDYLASGKNLIAVSVYNSIRNHNNKWATVELWIKGKYKGKWWQYYHRRPDGMPYFAVKPNTRIKWRITWNGQSKTKRYRAKTKGEALNYYVNKRRLKVRFD